MTSDAALLKRMYTLTGGDLEAARFPFPDLEKLSGGMEVLRLRRMSRFWKPEESQENADLEGCTESLITGLHGIGCDWLFLVKGGSREIECAVAVATLAPADKDVVADGEVEVIREDEGQTRTVAQLQKGQFFGEMAILRDMPRTATVKATKPTTLLAMERDGFRSLIAQSLATTEDFDQIIQRRMEELAPARAEG